MVLGIIGISICPIVLSCAGDRVRGPEACNEITFSADAIKGTAWPLPFWCSASSVWW